MQVNSANNIGFKGLLIKDKGVTLEKVKEDMASINENPADYSFNSK